MAFKKSAVLAFILISTALVPAASAWQEQMRSVTQARMMISGVLALGTLPSIYIHQQAQNTTSEKFPADKSSAAQLFLILGFAFAVVSLGASYAILALPDEMGGTSLIDHWAYWVLLCVAISGLFMALLSIATAISLVATLNPWSGRWDFIAVSCVALVTFVFVIFIWLSCGVRKAMDTLLPV